jgi:hypothetical protein
MSDQITLDRGFFDEQLLMAKKAESERIIKLLTELGAIRRDALGHLVAFNTDGTEVIYLEGLEK